MSHLLDRSTPCVRGHIGLDEPPGLGFPQVTHGDATTLDVDRSHRLERAARVPVEHQPRSRPRVPHGRPQPGPPPGRRPRTAPARSRSRTRRPAPSAHCSPSRRSRRRARCRSWCRRGSRRRTPSAAGTPARRRARPSPPAPRGRRRAAARGASRSSPRGSALPSAPEARCPGASSGSLSSGPRAAAAPPPYAVPAPAHRACWGGRALISATSEGSAILDQSSGRVSDQSVRRAPVAQRIEHLTTDQKVWGSNPYGRAIENRPGSAPPPTLRAGGDAPVTG